MLNQVIHGDCLEVLRTMPDNSVDAVVTDPPYGLSREPDIEEVLRHWLAGDDYNHRGGGFMGKEWDSFVPGPAVWREVCRVVKPGGHILCFAGTRTVDLMGISLRLGGFEIRDCLQWLYGSGFPKSHNISKAIDKRLGGTPKRGRFLYKNGKTAGGERIGQLAGGAKHYETIPDTEQAQKWQGWGTALKPANEPIVLARKPLSEKTIAENVIKWGTGGLNIDRCRIGTEVLYNNYCKPKQGYMSDSEGSSGGAFSKDGVNIAQGRFPANVILDEEAGRMLDEQQEGVSRFFYCAKASRKERGEFNKHPTVKPIALMEYLIKLVTPPEGIVLDPFLGSGTTALAALNLGRFFIGIELNEEYCEIARRRIEQHKTQTELFA